MLLNLGDLMKKEIKAQLEDKRKEKSKANIKWCLTLMLVAAVISVTLSFISEYAMRDVNLFVGTIIILIFIFFGILFDMIGVAVTAADEAPFHAMSAKKIKGAKTAVKLKKSSDRTSSFCCDVIGDICGIISGAAGVAVAARMNTMFNIPILVCSLIVTGFIAAITIGGKAFEKSIAINNGNKILYSFSKILNIFCKE